MRRRKLIENYTSPMGKDSPEFMMSESLMKIHLGLEVNAKIIAVSQSRFS